MSGTPGLEPTFYSPSEVATLLPWPQLIDAIERTVTEAGATAPERTVHQVPVPGGPDASLLLKPGWVAGDVIAVKAVTFFPDNGSLDLPTVNAGVLLFDGRNGTLLGACDGNELTTRRTAAASAVAAKRLARPDAARLLVVGTGALAPMTAQAHAAVRDFDTIEVWGRNGDKASAVVATLAAAGISAVAAPDLDAAVAAADVISCVTGATEPLVKGSLLSEGTHLDLIGAFTPTMRESDDDVIRRANVWVDTRSDGVLAGDLAIPLAAGLLTMDDIRGDLHDLISGASPGRTSADEITMFKSAGMALEDVAAARLVFGR
jgi:ornithine cyclodeaminase